LTRPERNQLKEKLKNFQNLEASDPQFTASIKDIMNDLSQHIKEEEESDLPTL
jgi:hemerythrin-like domain-containing protein